eukprot:5749984-Pleurochrysis_carterae.AAC.1
MEEVVEGAPWKGKEVCCGVRVGEAGCLHFTAECALLREQLRKKNEEKSLFSLKVNHLRDNADLLLRLHHLRTEVVAAHYGESGSASVELRQSLASSLRLEAIPKLAVPDIKAATASRLLELK